MGIKLLLDWLLRFVKGMFIGSGAILPGVSGGALAAVFGIYERIIAFLADIRKDFFKNVLYFFPVGLGGLFGLFALAHPLDYFLQHAEFQVLWCFIGCILGTLPSLYREAGKNGRKPRHVVIATLTAILAFAGLFSAREWLTISLPLNTGTWILSGAIFALGMIIPGLSPSNFLMYFGLYEPMTAGIKHLDPTVVIPVGIGGLICVLSLAKLMRLILKKAYAGTFHFIFGIVIASTAIIAPTDWSHATGPVVLQSVSVFVLGIGVGLFMEWLDRTYRAE